MLNGGYIVLCDRYVYTSFARDGVRGCRTDWLRNLYGFARIPDVTLYFKLPMKALLERILSGRPKLKYFEAGMDMGYSLDINESFKMFQEKVAEQYESIFKLFPCVTIDATESIHEQQNHVRKIITAKLDIAQFQKGK